MAKVESDDDGRLSVDSGRQHMSILFVVRHPRNQRLVTGDPRLAEVGAQFSLEVSGENKGKMDFVVDKNTQVNGQVREGTAVTVQYQAMENGQNLAVSITANA